MPSKFKVSSGDNRNTHPYMRDMDMTTSWHKSKIIREGPLPDGVFRSVKIERDGIIIYSKTLQP